MKSFYNTFNAYDFEKIAPRHTHLSNPGPLFIPGCCGKMTNQFVFNYKLNVLQGPGGRIGKCGTKKDN